MSQFCKGLDNIVEKNYMTRHEMHFWKENPKDPKKYEIVQIPKGTHVYLAHNWTNQHYHILLQTQDGWKYSTSITEMSAYVEEVPWE